MSVCAHDWRIIDTRIDPSKGVLENPILDLKCRKCGVVSRVAGKKVLRSILNKKGGKHEIG